MRTLKWQTYFWMLYLFVYFFCLFVSINDALNIVECVFFALFCYVRFVMKININVREGRRMFMVIVIIVIIFLMHIECIGIRKKVQMQMLS